MKSEVKVMISIQKQHFSYQMQKYSNIFLMLLCINATLLHYTFIALLRTCLIHIFFFVSNKQKHLSSAVISMHHKVGKSWTNSFLLCQKTFEVSIQKMLFAMAKAIELRSRRSLNLKTIWRHSISLFIYTWQVSHERRGSKKQLQNCLCKTILYIYY